MYKNVISQFTQCILKVSVLAVHRPFYISIWILKVYTLLILTMIKVVYQHGYIQSLPVL